MSALLACGHLALAAVTPASGQGAEASGDVILSKEPIEARPIRPGFRGEDIVDAGPGYLVAGWAPGTPETPYVALLDGDLESVVWERMPHAEAGAMFTAVTRDPETGRAFVAGSAFRADVDGSDPLVVAIDTEGHELTRWHPVTDGNHQIWDVTHHAPTGAIFVAGETNYHRDGSHVFAAKLTSDLEPVWQRVFEFSLGRSGAYAMAPRPTHCSTSWTPTFGSSTRGRSVGTQTTARSARPSAMDGFCSGASRDRTARPDGGV